jgi:hypothetical protein
MTLFELIAEQRIAEALARGDFDYLPGAGKPLVFDDDPLLSPEQRMVNRILKNAGFAPREVLLRQAVAALRREIDALPPGEQREELKRKLTLRLVQLDETR